MSVANPMSEERWNEAWSELQTISPLRSTILRMRGHIYYEHLATLGQDLRRGLDHDAEDASHDIIGDLLQECGFTPDDIVSHLRVLAEASWLLGYCYKQDELPPEPPDDPNALNRVEGVPDWLYCQLRDEAAECMIEQAVRPSEYNRGVYTQALESFKAVSDNASEDAEKVVLRRALEVGLSDR